MLSDRVLQGFNTACKVLPLRCFALVLGQVQKEMYLGCCFVRPAAENVEQNRLELAQGRTVTGRCGKTSRYQTR